MKGWMFAIVDNALLFVSDTCLAGEFAFICFKLCARKI